MTGPWAHLRGFEVVSTSSWVRVGRLPADADQSAPFQLRPEPGEVEFDRAAGQLRLTVPEDGPHVVHLLLAAQWDPHLRLRAHDGGRFGYEHPDRVSRFGAVTATVGHDGVVELPVVDRLQVVNDGGTVNVRTVEQRCDLRANRGSVSIGDASRAGGGELSAGQFGVISFHRGNPRNPTIREGADRIWFALEERPATSVDRARAAIEPAASLDAAERTADQPPAQGPSTPPRSRGVRRTR